MSRDSMSSASIATDYKHQLHSEALSRARLLVKGCCEVFRSKEAGVQYILNVSREIAGEVVGDRAENTFAAYCRALWLEDEAIEKTWKDRTTNDAIDEAFKTLASRGIVAMQNVGGTTSMGWALVNEEIAKLRARKKTVVGGTFFHSQDTERAIAGGGLWLAFGAVDGSDQGALAVAGEVMAALRAEGVASEWDGTVDSRIHVLPFEWRKRRTTKAPAKQKSVAWRHFTHPDGRRWAVAGLNNRVNIRNTDSDGDVHERQTPSNDVQAGTAELIASQIADGFVEDVATSSE